MISKIRFIHSLPFLAVLALAGCGPATGSISGKVTFKDKPLSGGTVRFLTSDQKAKSAAIGNDGTYTIDKVPIGPAKISISPAIPVASMGPPGGKKMDPSKMGGGPDGAAAPNGEKAITLPANYQDPEKSGLTYTVIAGKQQHDIPLK